MRLSLVSRLLLVLAAIGAPLAALPALAAPSDVVSTLATAQSPAVRQRSVDRALLISDSAWLGLKLYGGLDSVQGFEHTLALASCRRRVSPSCRNYNDYVPLTLYDELDDHPTGFATLIVVTGYNDSDIGFTDDIDAIATLARSHGYRRIVWLTLRSNVSYESPGERGFAAVFERNNATLETIVESEASPEIFIADWARYARDQPGWFASDGIHLRNVGTFAAGDYLSRKMAFLDGRACPNPVSAGAATSDPCPDPDTHGPIIDLESLYPIDEPYPSDGFALSWEGSSSWPAPPWWERD